MRLFSLSTCSLLFDFCKVPESAQCYTDRLHHLGLTLPTAHSSNTWPAGHLWPSPGRTLQPSAISESWVSSAATSNPLGNSFLIWTHQGADRFCRLSAESHVSFHSLPRRFVVVTLHSADVANPSVVPQEPGISFATFGIQRRASLSLNPLQIISPFPPFFVLRCHFPPPGFRAFHWFRWAYITDRGPDSGRLNSRHF